MIRIKITLLSQTKPFWIDYDDANETEDGFLGVPQEFRSQHLLWFVVQASMQKGKIAISNCNLPNIPLTEKTKKRSSTLSGLIAKNTSSAIYLVNNDTHGFCQLNSNVQSDLQTFMSCSVHDSPSKEEICNALLLVRTRKFSFSKNINADKDFENWVNETIIGGIEDHYWNLAARLQHLLSTNANNIACIVEQYRKDRTRRLPKELIQFISGGANQFIVPRSSEVFYFPLHFSTHLDKLDAPSSRDSLESKRQFLDLEYHHKSLVLGIDYLTQGDLDGAIKLLSEMATNSHLSFERDLLLAIALHSGDKAKESLDILKNLDSDGDPVREAVMYIQKAWAESRNRSVPDGSNFSRGKKFAEDALSVLDRNAIDGLTSDTLRGEALTIMAKCMQSMVMLHSDKYDLRGKELVYIECEKHFRTTLNFRCQHFDEPLVLAQSFQDLGMIMDRLNCKTKCLEYYSLSLKCRQSLSAGNLVLIQSTIRLAEALVSNEKFSKAEKLLNEAISNLKTTRAHTPHLIHAYVSLYDLHSARQVPADKCLEALAKAYKLSEFSENNVWLKYITDSKVSRLDSLLKTRFDFILNTTIIQS